MGNAPCSLTFGTTPSSICPIMQRNQRVTCSTALNWGWYKLQGLQDELLWGVSMYQNKGGRKREETEKYTPSSLTPAAPSHFHFHSPCPHMTWTWNQWVSKWKSCKLVEVNLYVKLLGGSGVSGRGEGESRREEMNHTNLQYICVLSQDSKLRVVLVLSP